MRSAIIVISVYPLVGDYRLEVALKEVSQV
jgi:hypothetical protein